MNEIVTFDQGAPTLTALAVRQQVHLIQQIMQDVMQEGVHYGYVPGTEPKNEEERKTKKPTLLKAGAEKLLLVFRLDPEYEIVEKLDGDHLTITSTCRLFHIPTGQRIGSGMGSCSTRESKYAYRMGTRTCPHCGAGAIIKGKEEYGGGWICFERKGGCKAKFSDDDDRILKQQVGRVPNDDIADQYNTVLKMANKRSQAAAVLNATAASDFFTQDLEDMSPEAEGDEIGARRTTARRATVEQPRRRSAPPAPLAPPAPPANGAGAAPPAGEQQGDRLLSEGERSHIKKKLEEAALTDIDIKARFGCEVGGLKLSQFEAVRRYIADPTAPTC